MNSSTTGQQLPPSSSSVPSTINNTTTQRYRTMGEMIDSQYIFSFYGIIKATQMIFDLCVFICVSANVRGSPAVMSACGFIQFVSMLSFLTSLIYYVIHIFKLDRTCPMTVPFKFSEFLTSAITTLLFLICAILSSVYITVGNYFNVNMAAATFFTFSSLILYGADSIAQFVVWRNSSEGPYFSRTITLS